MNLSDVGMLHHILYRGAEGQSRRPSALLNRLLNRLRLTSGPEAEAIVVVSGLPRSGTSMMMRMLETGGLPVLTDHVRTPNVDNPKGYYEFERVKQLDEGDHAWLPAAQGKAVKIISALLQHLPADYTYKIIFMRRDIDEILASQRKMLIRRGEDPDTTDDAHMALLYERHLNQIDAWLAQQPHMEVLHVSYNELVEEPAPHVARVSAFLGTACGRLDTSRMIDVVDPTLYRQRREA